MALDGENNRSRTESVDLNSESSSSSDKSLIIDISDALSEKDKVKFTVHTKTTLKTFKENEFSVTRQHEEFIWLHDRYVENEDYGGLIIPPPPPRPDFDASREKLQRLGEGESTMTKEEFNKMKQELEAEYLAMFKKTVNMHEVFLQRLGTHPVLRNDSNFRVFLEYPQDLMVRGKNAKEKFGGLVKSLTKNADELRLSNQKDTDEFFEHQKEFLSVYNTRITDATMKSDRTTYKHKNVADAYIKVSSGLTNIATMDSDSLAKFLNKCAEFFEKARKTESRVSSDTDLKLSDTLRYYMRDSKAALDLLYRRSKRLADFENENKNLDKARAKNKDVAQAEQAQQTAKTKFEDISKVAKSELEDFKVRRVNMFKKSLNELTELQIKHAKVINPSFSILSFLF